MLLVRLATEGQTDRKVRPAIKGNKVWREKGK
jgi:hypothetical protein